MSLMIVCMGPPDLADAPDVRQPSAPDRSVSHRPAGREHTTGC
jgi:hypothetical protein